MNYNIHMLGSSLETNFEITITVNSSSNNADVTKVLNVNDQFNVLKDCILSRTRTNSLFGKTVQRAVLSLYVSECLSR